MLVLFHIDGVSFLHVESISRRSPLIDPEIKRNLHLQLFHMYISIKICKFITLEMQIHGFQ